MEASAVSTTQAKLQGSKTGQSKVSQIYIRKFSQNFTQTASLFVFPTDAVLVLLGGANCSGGDSAHTPPPPHNTLVLLLRPLLVCHHESPALFYVSMPIV